MGMYVCTGRGVSCIKLLVSFCTASFIPFTPNKYPGLLQVRPGPGLRANVSQKNPQHWHSNPGSDPGFNMPKDAIGASGALADDISQPFQKINF